MTSRRSVFRPRSGCDCDWRFCSRRRSTWQFEEFSLFSYGVKPERKRFTTFNQHMFSTGIALDGDLVTKHPELRDRLGGNRAS